MLNTIHTIVESVITLAFLLIFAWFADAEVEEDEFIISVMNPHWWRVGEDRPEWHWDFEVDPEFGQDIQDDWEEHLDEMYAQTEEGYCLGNTFCPEVDDEFVEDYLGICF